MNFKLLSRKLFLAGMLLVHFIAGGVRASNGSTLHAQPIKTTGTCIVFPEKYEPPKELVHEMAIANLPLHPIALEWRQELESKHHSFVLSLTVPIKTVDRSFTGLSPEALLIDRTQRGDLSARAILEFGFSWEQGSTGEYKLVPPSRFDVIPAIASARMLRMVRLGRISRLERAVFFGIPFIKKTANKSNLRFSDLMFVRPYLDPWPRREVYELLPDTSAQLNNPVIIEGLYHGLYPYFVGPFTNHEIGHVIDFSSDGPLTEATVDAIHRRFALAQGSWDVVFEESYLQSRRNFVTNEWMAVPDIAKRERLAGIIRPVLGLQNDAILSLQSELVGRLLVNPSLKLILGEFLETLHCDQSLIIPMGGAIRDFYNLYCRTARTEGKLINPLFDKLISRPEYVAEFLPYTSYVRNLSARMQIMDQTEISQLLLYQLAEARLLYEVGFGDASKRLEFLNNLDVKARAINKSEEEIEKHNSLMSMLRSVSDSEFRKVVVELLVERAVNIAFNIAAALQFNITPAQIMKDSSLSKVPKDSPTHNYFRFFAYPDSYYYRLFVEDSD